MDKTLARRYVGGYQTADEDERRIGRAYVVTRARLILAGKVKGSPHWHLGYVDGVEGGTPKYTEIDCVG